MVPDQRGLEAPSGPVAREPYDFAGAAALCEVENGKSLLCQHYCSPSGGVMGGFLTHARSSQYFAAVDTVDRVLIDVLSFE